MMGMHKMAYFMVLALNFSRRVEENYENVRIADFWPRFQLQTFQKEEKSFNNYIATFTG
jgi:hypothetical protein